MDWIERFIDEILREVPQSSYRTRIEQELRDHMETQYWTLAKAGRTPQEAREEIRCAMGEPEKLQKEYRAAWRRYLPGRLEVLGNRLAAWAGGFAVMGGVHFLIAYVLTVMWSIAIALPGDSQNKWVRLIRGAAEDYHNSMLRHWLPLVLALAAGAYYLARKFRASRHPVALISVGLSFHWAYITAFIVWWQAIDNHHRPFWEAVGRQLYYGAWYYALTFALCILLGQFFGRFIEKKEPQAA